MARNKTHFAWMPPFDASETAACGRGRDLYMTPDVSGVTCKVCLASEPFLIAEDEQKVRLHAARMAKGPRTMREPWRDGNIVCSMCGSDQFYMGSRTCYGHYQNYDCAECAHSESRLTETGMSF